MSTQEPECERPTEIASMMNSLKEAVIQLGEATNSLEERFCTVLRDGKDGEWRAGKLVEHEGKIYCEPGPANPNKIKPDYTVLGGDLNKLTNQVRGAVEHLSSMEQRCEL